MKSLIPFRNFLNVFDVLDDFWADLEPTVAFGPATNMYEKGEEIGLEVEMPGIEPKDVSLSVDKGILSISYENKKEKETKDKRYYRVERSTRNFQRSFYLPKGIDENKIVADYKNGILSIKFPKLLKENKAKQIPIKT